MKTGETYVGIFSRIFEIRRHQNIQPQTKNSEILPCKNRENLHTSNEIYLLSVMLDSKLKFDAHVASVCRKVGGQVNVTKHSSV